MLALCRVDYVIYSLYGRKLFVGTSIVNQRLSSGVDDVLISSRCDHK